MTKKTVLQKMVSISSSGEQGNAASQWIGIVSGDGRYVSFSSEATNLVPGDLNKVADAFVHDIQTGITEMVSVSSLGEQGNYSTISGVISSDGRYISFSTGSNNLVPNDTNERPDVFIRDTVLGLTEIVSLSSSGAQGNGTSSRESISADGRYVVFRSSATNLVPNDTNGQQDLFVHDRETGNTEMVSLSSTGVQGNAWSLGASISDDGRYVAFSSDATNLVLNDTNSVRDLFVHDRVTNITEIIPISNIDTQSNGDSITHGILSSSDMRYIAFSSEATNLIPNDSNGFTDAFIYDTQGLAGEIHRILGNIANQDNTNIPDATVTLDTGQTTTTNSQGEYGFINLAEGTYTITVEKEGFTFEPSSKTVTVPPDQTNIDFTGRSKPPLILIHGFQGTKRTHLNCSFFNFNQNPAEISQWNSASTPSDPGMLDAQEYWQDMPSWLSQDYDVWVAQLKTGLVQGTPPLEINGICLANQIQHVYQETGQKPILIAHSMGGLVSRACLSVYYCRANVEKLVTLGSPHAGLPLTQLGLIVGCLNQDAACQMARTAMPVFNLMHANTSSVDYFFLGGGARAGDGYIWFGEANDGLIGAYSSVGWVYPYQLFVPFWSAASYPMQYRTNEVHSPTFDGNHYYMFRDGGSTKSYAYQCLDAWLKSDSIPAGCTQVTGTAQASVQGATYDKTATLSGQIDLAETLTRTLQVDTTASSIFYTSWQTGTVAVSLIRPDGQVIDEAYANTHPDEVIYSYTQGGEIYPEAKYSFASTLPGEWIVQLAAIDIGANPVDYVALAYLETTTLLTANTNAQYYSIGNTVQITANLSEDSSFLAGVPVLAKILKEDGTVAQVVLSDNGKKSYVGKYVTDSSGYLIVRVIAEDPAFSREENLLVMVGAEEATLTGNYADQGIDDNDDGIYEHLELSAEINVADPGGYLVTAVLEKDGVTVARTTFYGELLVGTSQITLEFSGEKFFQSKLDGPYTVANITVLKVGSGIPTQIANNVFTTQFYNHKDFGRETLYLPVIIKN